MEEDATKRRVSHAAQPGESSVSNAAPLGGNKR